MKGHIFDASTVTSADTYTKTRKKLISYVAENFTQPQYVINSIEAKTAHTFTTPATPVPIPPATTINDTKIEIHKRHIDLYVKNENTFDQNMVRLYYLIWNQCTEELKQRLQGEDTFEVMKNGQQAIELLNLVKMIYFKFDTMKYTPVAIHMSVRKFYLCRQDRNMSNQAYYDKLLNAYNVVKTYNGNIGEHYFLRDAELQKTIGANFSLNTATEAQRQEALTKSTEQYLAVAMLLSADRRHNVRNT